MSLQADAYRTALAALRLLRKQVMRIRQTAAIVEQSELK
jgi:hypothetical protein